MATQEKLQKSLEILKNLSNSVPSDITKKKEKIHHCHIVTECISNSTIKVSTNFQDLLGITIETFLRLCDDDESDVRMISEECLNRVIRAVSDSNISKVQIELTKELRRNEAARSLRVALARFSQLTHLIRPHKGKPYVKSLFPSLVRIVDRKEEQVHETLNNSLPNIMRVLGRFTSDIDIKILLKAFLANICNQSAVIRRTSANCILVICMNSKKPSVFITYCINNLLNLVIPVTEIQDDSIILGVLSGLKTLIPHLKTYANECDDYGSTRDDDPSISVTKMLEIYELTLYYLTKKDHNIINASLETLNILLLHASVSLKDALLCLSGIDKSRIFQMHYSANVRSPSQLSMATNLTSTEDNICSESDLTETIHSDIESWIDKSVLSVKDNTLRKSADKSLSLDALTNTAESLDTCDYDHCKLPENKKSMFSTSLDSNLDKVADSDGLSVNSLSCSGEKILSVGYCFQEINIGDYLDKDIPLLYCVRLLTNTFLLSGSPGNYINDKIVRVSVKSLALTCLSSIMGLYPYGLLKYLDKNCSGSSTNNRISHQQISDIVLFKNHPDPQLRGVVMSLLSNFIASVLLKSGGNYKKWIESNAGILEASPLEMEQLMAILGKGLSDDSTNCLRQTLLGLSVCINPLIESQCSYCVLPVLNILPQLASSSYWLAKVALCELVSNISFLGVFYVSGNTEFQSKVIHNILLELLKDSDPRVRTASAKSIAQIIPLLYYEEYKIEESPESTMATYLKNKYLPSFNDAQPDMNINKKHFIDNMAFPFCKIENKCQDRIDFSLSKMVHKLYQSILVSTSKYFIYGCIEALSVLSNEYPCTVYKKSWNSSGLGTERNKDGCVPELFNLCISFLSSSTHVYDMNCQINVLNLTANLFAGHSLALIKPVISEGDHSPQIWEMFRDSSYADLTEQLLSHLVKLLCVFHHVISETVPHNPSSKVVLPHLPSTSNISPIKRRKSDIDKKVLSPIKMTEKDDKTERRDTLKGGAMGNFMSSQHYLKLYDILRSSFSNYKVSLDSEASEKMLDLMRKTIHGLSVIMEVATLTEFSRISEEILGYLRSTFTLDSTSSVQCVQQLLKCLFSTNLTANILEIGSKIAPPSQELQDQEGIYYNLFQKPYEDMAFTINTLSTINKIGCDGDSTLMGYLHSRKVTTLSRSSDKILANYIKIFEPMVIKSLKQYTITTDVRVQCRVLQLINQLVQLRVNYCLLDSDQVFVGFMLKQFEFIEEGQIPFTEDLIPKIFQFLVQLSYSKQHSKCIISVPKIIQLCDGLMASGQSAKTHCLPALPSIVEDIFLTRNKANTADMAELETTREVVLSMLLRLVEYTEVIDLISLVLNDSKYCNDNSDKWLRWSEQVSNTVFRLLKQDKIRLDDPRAFESLRMFIFALNPRVFKNIDHVIIMLFQEPPEPQNNRYFSRWLCKINIILLILTPMKEDLLISRINELKPDFSPNSIYENVATVADPLNVHNNATTFNNISAEEILVRFIMKVIFLSSKIGLEEINNEDSDFLIEQISVFLLHCLYILQSGSHCKVTNEAIVLMNTTSLSTQGFCKITEINKNMLHLSSFYPTVSVQWLYILTLINYNEISFWKGSFETDLNIQQLKNPSVKVEIFKVGGLLVFCDYLTENRGNHIQVQWVLEEHTPKLIDLISETPIHEFIAFIHRNSSTSQLFNHIISEKYLSFNNVIFKTKILKCIENCHLSQVGEVLKILIPKMLNYQHTSVNRLVANLSSRKIELLLTLPMEEVTSQLSREDLIEIKNTLISLNLVKRHEALVGLVNKLLIQYYDLSPIEFDQRRVVNPDYIKKLQINKHWYTSQINGKSRESKLGKETADVLRRLEFSEIMCFMSSTEFNRLYLHDCIQLGVKSIRMSTWKEEPPILKAATACLLKDIENIKSKISEPHQVFEPIDRTPSLAECKYSNDMTKLFSETEFANLVMSISKSVSSFLDSLPIFPTIKIPDTSVEDLIQFGVLCLEFTNYIILHETDILNISVIDKLLNSSCRILQDTHLSFVLMSDNYMSWLCSAVNSLYRLVGFLLKNKEPLPSVPYFFLKRAVENNETRAAGQACHQLYVLVCWLSKIKGSSDELPKFLLNTVNSIIISLSRQPLFNSYLLIPLKVLKSGWDPALSGTFNTQVPPLPIDLLQEIDILEEYIFRISLFGWTSRQQFEETWMCLLSVLCNPINDLDPVEVNDILRASCLAIKSITTLLLQTLYYPEPGNSRVSKIVHVSRNQEIPEDTVSVKKLKNVQSVILHKYEELAYQNRIGVLRNIFDSVNFERICDKYSFGQLSIKYFLIATHSLEEFDQNSKIAVIYRKRKEMFEESGLDVNSCIQFLLDYYSQLLKQDSEVHLRVLYEVVRSILMISDIFTDKSQFTWMMTTFWELSKSHTTEDELLYQYLVVGICKAVAILTPDLEVYEQVKKLLVQYLKSPYLSSRIAGLHGLLYILEGCKLSNITIGGISDEMQLILPCAVEYVQLHLNTTNIVLRKSQEHTMLVWSLAFYLIENIDESHMESNFVSNFLQTAFVVLQTKLTTPVHQSILKGLERLLVIKKKSLLERIGKQLLKLATEKMKDDNPSVSILGTQLLFSYMYIDCTQHLENSKSHKEIQTNPDHLEQTIEKISIIFERIKKGYSLEAEILCSVLPTVLGDFFSPSDILTKVIGEFLSPQQPHPKLMSKVVFEVFEYAIKQNQQSLLQDWVVFSLANFTQSFSIGMATWCLTCFFISASSNEWLRSYFPYVQTRVGRCDYEDRKMLCIAGSDFYRSLTNDKQKQTFIDNFKKVKDQPDMLFSDLLSSC